MNARVSTYDLSIEKLEDGVRGFTEAIDRIRSLEGFQEALLLVDRENAQAITITLWEDVRAMEASRVPASRARSEAARSADGEIKSTCEYEIAVRQTAS